MKKSISVLLILTCLLGSVVAAASTVTGDVYQEQARQEIERLGVRDVAPTDWAALPLVHMAEAGLLPPSAPGELRPTASTTAGEGVMVFARVMGLVGPSASNADAVNALANAGVVDPSSVLNENRDFTRGEMIIMMARALNIAPSSAPSPFTDVSGLTTEQQGLLTSLYRAGLLAGYEDHTVRFDSVLSRAELAAFVERILGRIGR